MHTGVALGEHCKLSQKLRANSSRAFTIPRPEEVCEEGCHTLEGEKV